MFRVKIGRAKSAREILGTEVNVQEFNMLGEGGHHYQFNAAMDSWGRIQAMLVFVPIRADIDHLGMKWMGTLDGNQVALFRPEWIELTSTEEMADDDPRVSALLKVALKGLHMEPVDIERKMADGTGSA